MDKVLDASKSEKVVADALPVTASAPEEEKQPRGGRKNNKNNKRNKRKANSSSGDGLGLLAKGMK